MGGPGGANRGLKESEDDALAEPDACSRSGAVCSAVRGYDRRRPGAAGWRCGRQPWATRPLRGPVRRGPGERGQWPIGHPCAWRGLPLASRQLDPGRLCAAAQPAAGCVRQRRDARSGWFLRVCRAVCAQPRRLHGRRDHCRGERLPHAPRVGHRRLPRQWRRAHRAHPGRSARRVRLPR